MLVYTFLGDPFRKYVKITSYVEQNQNENTLC